MPEYRPPRRLVTMRQTSPLVTARPLPGQRPPIADRPHTPMKFTHEHYTIGVERKTTTTGEGDRVVVITATASIVVPDVSGSALLSTAAELLRCDQEVADGQTGRVWTPQSRRPQVDFPPCEIVCDEEHSDRESVDAMTWRALDGAVSIADRCLDIMRQVAPLRAEQIARAEG